MGPGERIVLLGENIVTNYAAVAECETRIISDEKKDIEETKDEESQRQERDPDSAWLIVAASFLCICVLDGTMYSFGSLLAPLMLELQQPRSTISLVGSLQVASSAFIAPVAAWLVGKRGARSVCLAGALTASFGLLLASFSSNLVGIFVGLSLLTGTGFGLMYIPAVVAVAENFTAQRSLALGLSLSGSGAGQVLVAPLVSMLVQSCGWRGAVQGLASLTLCTCAGTGLVIRAGPPQAECPVSHRPETGTSRHGSVFLLMVVGDALAVMGLYIPYSYLQPVARAAGVSPSLSTLLIPAIGGGSVAGRLLSGWLSDQPWCHPLYLTRLVVAMSGPLPFLCAWVDHAWMFAGLGVSFGFLTGQWIAATSPLLISLLGIEQLSQAFGLLTFVRGVASLLSPPLAGIMVDLTTNPHIALFLSGGLFLLSGGVYSLAIAIFPINSRKYYRDVVYQRI